MAYCDEIENIECIASMTKMENLGLMGCGIKDISFLRDMKKLHSINLSENKIEDITLLAEFSNLSGVVLDDNKITDVSALVGLENLVFVSLYDNPIQNAGLLVGVDPCFDVTVGRGAKMEAWNAEVEKALQVYDVTVEVDGHLQEVEDYYVGDATGDGIADIGIVTSWQNEEADGVRLDRWLCTTRSLTRRMKIFHCSILIRLPYVRMLMIWLSIVPAVGFSSPLIKEASAEENRR